MNRTELYYQENLLEPLTNDLQICLGQKGLKWCFPWVHLLSVEKDLYWKVMGGRVRGRHVRETTIKKMSARIRILCNKTLHKLLQLPTYGPGCNLQRISWLPGCWEVPPSDWAMWPCTGTGWQQQPGTQPAKLSGRKGDEQHWPAKGTRVLTTCQESESCSWVTSTMGMDLV